MNNQEKIDNEELEGILLPPPASRENQIRPKTTFRILETNRTKLRKTATRGSQVPPNRCWTHKTMERQTNCSNTEIWRRTQKPITTGPKSTNKLVVHSSEIPTTGKWTTNIQRRRKWKWEGRDSNNRRNRFWKSKQSSNKTNAKSDAKSNKHPSKLFSGKNKEQRNGTHAN